MRAVAAPAAAANASLQAIFLAAWMCRPSGQFAVVIAHLGLGHPMGVIWKGTKDGAGLKKRGDEAPGHGLGVMGGGALGATGRPGRFSSSCETCGLTPSDGSLLSCPSARNQAPKMPSNRPATQRTVAQLVAPSPAPDESTFAQWSTQVAQTQRWHCLRALCLGSVQASAMSSSSSTALSSSSSAAFARHLSLLVMWRRRFLKGPPPQIVHVKAG